MTICTDDKYSSVKAAYALLRIALHIRDWKDDIISHPDARTVAADLECIKNWWRQ